MLLHSITTRVTAFGFAAIVTFGILGSIGARATPEAQADALMAAKPAMVCNA